MPEIGGDVAAWVVVLTGVITGLGALIMNRRGAKETHESQVAANRIAEDRHRLEETQQALDAMQSLADKHLAEAERWRKRALDAEHENDEQRNLHRAMYAAQEARCREYAQELTEVVLVLRRVVVDEVAKQAADVALTWEKHPHGPPVVGTVVVEEEGEGDERNG